MRKFLSEKIGFAEVLLNLITIRSILLLINEKHMDLELRNAEQNCNSEFFFILLFMNTLLHRNSLDYFRLSKIQFIILTKLFVAT